MKNVFKFIALSAMLMSFALFAGSVFAQTSTTGSIEGSVSDTSGAAVPGISVRVTSPNLISAQTAVTDDSGRYKILIPGRLAYGPNPPAGSPLGPNEDLAFDVHVLQVVPNAVLQAGAAGPQGQ